MKRISNEKIVMKEVLIPTGDDIGGIPVVYAEKEIDMDATLQAQLDADREEVKEIFEEIEKKMVREIHCPAIGSDCNALLSVDWQALKQKHLGD